MARKSEGGNPSLRPVRVRGIKRWVKRSPIIPGIDGGGEVEFYQSGGIVPGRGEQVAIVRGGERIVPTHQIHNANTYNFSVNSGRAAAMFEQMLRQQQREDYRMG